MQIKNYYPGFTPKAITFSIDDGNLILDKVFIDIVRPAGITGSFNLYFGRAPREISDEEYRELYRGFEISNHCNRHPHAFNPEKEYNFTDEPFNRETADTSLVYKSDREGVYLIHPTTYWSSIATREAYLQLAEEGRRDIEEIFGKGSVRCFVWPFGKQRDEKLYEALKNSGYYTIRKAYSEGYGIPEDRLDWGVNADSTNFETKIVEFAALPDDGKLKFFCIGLHSSDFKRNNKWEEFRAFAAEYGNRPSDFWYASPSDIFEYSDAIEKITVKDSKIINPTEKELYIAIDGKKYILTPFSETEF